jgi:hypothetical protein
MSDPMSELLKIEPSSLGVGMYQKDISASDIKSLAEEVADSCVHFAGVDANTAGVHLLQVCAHVTAAIVQASSTFVFMFHCVNGLSLRKFHISASVALDLRLPRK